MNPITWGGGDSVELKTQLETDPRFIPTQWCFGRRWIDCKTLFISMAIGQELKLQSGLAKSMVRCGLQFKGAKHRADDDALNTFILYRHLVKSMPRGIIK
jgi:inhibitor of KinA sporulation pathway (predicted exonuclease)